MAVRVQRNSVLPDRNSFFPGSGDQRPEFNGQSIPRQLQHIQAGFAWCGFQVGSRAPAELDHFHCTVNDDSGRGMVLQHQPIGLGLHIEFAFRRVL